MWLILILVLEKNDNGKRSRELLQLFYSFENFLIPVLAEGFSREFEWQKVSRTLLSILADLNNAVVWMVSTCLLIFKSFSLSILWESSQAHKLRGYHALYYLFISTLKKYFAEHTHTHTLTHTHTYIYTRLIHYLYKDWLMVDRVLWHINLCRLFNARSYLYI